MPKQKTHTGAKRDLNLKNQDLLKETKWIEDTFWLKNHLLEREDWEKEHMLQKQIKEISRNCFQHKFGKKESNAIWELKEQLMQLRKEEKF